MEYEKLKTLGDLKKANYSSKTIKDELRDNLIAKIKNNSPIFDGVIGYEDTVIPQLKTAILSKHNINLLGLRGQAKTRIARSMIDLLDEFIPVVKGSAINDDPFCPISSYAKRVVDEKKDETPIVWLHRSERFYEKLATPDVSVADLIGDIDPIKAATQRLTYSDEEVIHFGMIPRANRSIFVINELPDLQARIQVALFNILQEGDVQIRGFKMRLPLDVNFIFTANPEDYTNRGSIVTPLKDRIGSQILTHYPKDIETAKKITSQEAKTRVSAENVFVPEVAKDLLEQIVFEARKSPYIDANSGVSARMSITMYENLISAAELRALESENSNTSVRMSDFELVTPAITGKVELVYEGEQEGAEKVAQSLIGEAVKAVFNQVFEPIKKLQKPDEFTVFDKVVQWFIENHDFELPNSCSDEEYKSALNEITPLSEVIEKYVPNSKKEEQFFYKELFLWGLVEYKRLTKKKMSESYSIGDEILGQFYGR
jgi:magnesium chelatase subunit I